ncbi:MAG: response regulator [Candidatus Vogelbacteria bacterium]|nr:response regulator [Candidatus Vogelbacteria bacterium]
MTVSKKYILVVDDDPLLAELYCKKLALKNFDVAIANDGIETLAKISVRHPDLVILDINMPKKNGVETIKELKSNDATKNIPVLINSNMNDDPKDVEAVKRLGAIDCLVKANTSIGQLCQTVENFFTTANNLTSSIN